MKYKKDSNKTMIKSQIALALVGGTALLILGIHDLFFLSNSSSELLLYELGGGFFALILGLSMLKARKSLTKNKLKL